jgi:uncharacterized membrane protein
MDFIEKNITVNAPVEKVWQVWTDVAHTPDWVEGVEESIITSTVKEGKGLSWKEKCLFGKQVIQMDHEFTTWEPLKKTVIRSGLPMGGTMERTAEFESHGATTQVKAVLEWDLGMVGAFIGEDKLKHMMGKSFDLTIAKWKAKIEQ